MGIDKTQQRYRSLHRTRPVVPEDQIEFLPMKVTSHGYTNRRVDMGVWVGEHVLVMEAALGERLPPGASVHHRNGKRSDNRPSNLEVWTSTHPSGQRLGCPKCKTTLVAA